MRDFKAPSIKSTDEMKGKRPKNVMITITMGYLTAIEQI